MRYLTLIIVLLIIGCSSCQQKPQGYKRPKMVIGLVIDQMRWDYLYRYYDLYGNDGFTRLIRDGYNCQNTHLNYLPSFTGPGHSCIYTGSVPSITGIAGNNWIDNNTGRSWYCVDDDSASQVGGKSSKEGSFSPRNLLTTTITDELRLATNFRSHVFGIAIKDRGAILPAGHTANGAYWYDELSGDFVSSTYYSKKYQKPVWLDSFNKKGTADKLTKQDWTLLYNKAMYIQSTPDSNGYEGVLKGENFPTFPHSIGQQSKLVRLNAIKTMPAGNTLTLDMARACIDGEHLGRNTDPDFLCVSLSSPDYAGHLFAPNSMEMEDMYLRLDKEIASFLSYLDKTVGNGNYVLFLTADHGGSHNPQFLVDNKIPAGISFNLTADLNNYLKGEFGTDSPFVRGIINYQVFLNEQNIPQDSALLRNDIKASIRKWLMNNMQNTYKVPVSYVIDMEDIDKSAVPEPIRTMAINGYNHNRSGCLQIILNPGWFEADGYTGTTHGSWNPYDSHIPLIWYGWRIPKGETFNSVNMTDISATLAALLYIQEPNGCIGKPIKELLK
jgi:predicted AlkP superfamily pyrophosphatase or phosphodiesterase